MKCNVEWVEQSKYSIIILNIITISLIISNIIVLLEERMPDRKVWLLCEALTKWQRCDPTGLVITSVFATSVIRLVW